MRALHRTSLPASEQFTSLVESDSTFLFLPWWVSSTGVLSSSITSKQREIKIRHSAGAVQWSEKPVYPHRFVCCLYAALLHLTVRVDWIGTRPAFAASQGPLFSKPRSSTLKDTALGFLSISVYLPLSLSLPPVFLPLHFPSLHPSVILSYFCAVSLTDCYISTSAQNRCLTHVHIKSLP